MLAFAAVLIVAGCMAWGVGSMLSYIPRIYAYRATYIVGGLLCFVCLLGFVTVAVPALIDSSPAGMFLTMCAFALGLVGFSLLTAMRLGRRRAAARGPSASAFD